MAIREVRIELTAETDLLVHADNIEWADRMEAWKKDPDNKNKSKAGDDRTPAWRWIGCLNTDGAILTIPSEYIMACALGGSAEVPTGRGKKTFKSQSQSGIVCQQFHWPLLVKGKPIQMKDIQPLMEIDSFNEHVERVSELGFSLFIKRAKIGAAKHVRVRPRFSQWGTTGDLTIVDEQITDKVLDDILRISGRYKGIGDWRPGSPSKPGPWGMFTAKILSSRNGAK